MSDAQLPITGYLDRFSHRPGQTFTAFISTRTPGPCRVRLVRVVSGDPNPAGPGMQLEDRSAVFDHSFPGRNQPIRLGSSAIVDRVPAGDATAARTWTVLACPGIPGLEQVVLAEQGNGAAACLLLGPGGAVAELSGPAGTTRLTVDAPIRKGRWYRLWLSVDPSGAAILGQQAVAGGPESVARAETAGPIQAGGTLTIAARDPAAPNGHFTGRVQDPAIRQGFAPTAAALAGLPTLAAWDFSRGMATQAIEDTGPDACHGRLLNLPTRAMAGADWSGREMCWRHAPRDYAAIHFHADDLGDCGWQADFTWTVPDDLASGAYALHLSCAEGEDWLPLYILPRRTGPFAKIAFLASTFTYQAYFNHARDNADEAYQGRVKDWGAYPYNPDQYPLYGRSTYNVHLDGSGISFSSRLRPVLTMRPGFLTFNDARGSGLRHYPADTHLLAWLEARGIAFDVITDEDLDDEGVDLLRPYRGVLTGSHPEYHTVGTLDALAAYTQAGGRMAYLGGNGFYWRIARDKAMPWATELRRAEGGIRTWAAEPGEYYHQLDGAYGGLWRRNRRPPQMLAGVGFSGQGLFEGTYYRLLPAARDPRFAWLLEGIEGDTLGDYGLSGGGAAGFELDRADDDLGTPDGAVILARSEDPPASFFTVPEEVLAGRRTVTGERLEDLMRAEIVWFPTAGGGEVFSVGSITFCGSLWKDGAFDGPVSRLLENVVRRFAG
ncbi:MAG: N,N-dimethylformamidase large subunit [Acetobacteraceae bacterium]|nr:N,N-dimethylformamidase large subunit [Acetobacteraceae bacterium]